MTLMKLRLNMPLEDLAYRLIVSVCTVLRTFDAWIVMMDVRLWLFVWLTRSVNDSMPSLKIFIPAFVTVNRMVVTWFTVVEDRLQSTLA